MVKRTTTTTVVAATLYSMLVFSTTSVTPVVGIEQQQQGVCTLACPTDAPCKFGNVDFSGHPLNEQGQPIIISDTNDEGRHNIDGMHCDCPPTWTGVKCDQKFDSCDDDHKCYHGGKCIPGLKDRFHNTQYFCDCSEAYSPIDGTRYGGKYCETQYLNSCRSDVNDEEIFCVNGGDCNSEYPNYGPPCYCPDTYEGEHCEFRKGTVPECTLECLNGGHCVVGINNPIEADVLYNLWSADETQEHMRCICPTGYGGRNCESPISKEGKSCGPYHCLNGGKCVETTFSVGGGSVETDYHCDCTSAEDENGDKYAGRFCQYRATDYCTDGDDLENGIHGTLFCVNGGLCSADPSDGCDCPDDFSGHKCDYRIDNPTQKEPEPIECGDTFCYNNGKCTTYHVADDDGYSYSRQGCDCSTATTATALFAGTSCQYRSTDICTDPEPGAQSLEGALFCTNHGSCKSNPAEGCDCPHGFKGDKCQFTTTDEDESHFTGGDDCGGDGLVCYNGGECVETTFFLENGGNRTDYTCDCAPAFDDEHLYSGSSCQYKSTQLCTEPTDDDETLEGHLFCTNHGTCKENPRHGCDCPKGFTGFRCEYETTTYVDEADDENNDGVADDETHQTVRCAGRVCHNGGGCVTDIVTMPNGKIKEEFSCDCSTAYSDTSKFGGPTCQHKQTSVCGDAEDYDDMKDAPVCFNHGECPANPGDDCICKTGWAGPRCEIEVDDDVLEQQDEEDDMIQKCGDVYCLNGGNCVMTMEEDTGFKKEYHCDCSTAVTDTDLYAGSTCQHKSTTFCTQPAHDAPTPEGAMFCVNGGRCKENPYEGCECSSAFTGFHCEYSVEEAEGVEFDKSVIVDVFVVCGDGHCYNGGTCDSFLQNEKENAICDCTTATTETTAYDGEYCEYKATIFCDDPDPVTGLEGVFFCVNGGQCNEDEPLKGCICPTGYEGLKCEFPLFGQENIRPNLPGDHECMMQCQNGGTCVKGAKDLGSMESLIGNVDHLNDTYSEEFFEHCYCPEGWVGLACEIPVVACGEGEHLCFHGSTCISNDDQYGCDCTRATTRIGDQEEQTYFGGKHCEHPAADICTVGESHPLKPMYFCFNRGTCKEKVDGDTESHPGCDCPAGWEGRDCAIRSREESGVFLNAEVLFFMAAAAVFMISGLMVVACCIRVDPDEKDESTQCLPFRRRRRRSYENPADRVNIAALKGSDYGDSLYSDIPPSNRDPMVGLTAPPTTDDGVDSSSSSGSRSSEYEEDDYDDEPIVHIPERDEDNRPLYDVNII